ncbi:MAG: hypothetical protein HW388_1481 [Dehalococcoidia bacterium]|nr:hypothetical protein [Dehalococcoidia bacterium]
MGSGETPSIRVFNQGTPLPQAALIIAGTANLIDSAGNQVSQNLAAPNPPGIIDFTLSMAGVAGRWQLVIPQINVHYRLQKLSGSDTGVYINALTFGQGSIAGTIQHSGGGPFPDPLQVNLSRLLIGGSTVPVASLITNTGSYNFANLFVGNYRVAIVPPPGMNVIGPSFFDVFVSCEARTTVSAFIINRPPVANAGPDQVVNEGATVQLDASASSDPDNNTLTFNWTVVSFTGSAITLSSSTVANPTFSALDDGVYALRVTVNDGNGGTASDDVQVTVNNVAPVVNAGADQTLPFGTLVNVSASFTDPGTKDTWTYSIDWGDGSPADTGSATVASPVTGSHQYVVAGNQTITVCVTDDDLGNGCDSLTVTFISGIGKITGGVLRFGNNGRGGFNVQSNDGVTVKGELQYQNGSVNLHAHTMTAVAVSSDLKKGWFAGVLEDGREFVVYVEDNGEPGRNDIFKMWVDGTLLNGDGKLTGGNVQIHK